MLHLIKRAKKCLDFSATLYLIHLFICIVYGGWPSSITWWIINGTGFAVMALLGEWLCMRQELLEIPLPRFRSLGSGKLNLVFLPLTIQVFYFYYIFIYWSGTTHTSPHTHHTSSCSTDPRINPCSYLWIGRCPTIGLPVDWLHIKLHVWIMHLVLDTFLLLLLLLFTFYFIFFKLRHFMMKHWLH